MGLCRNVVTSAGHLREVTKKVEVINPLNQYTMIGKRYMLIHMDEYVYRFNYLEAARYCAERYCRGKYEFYVIVDVEENEVVEKWSYHQVTGGKAAL